MENKRRCTTCKEEKPATLDYFYKSTKVSSGLQSVCKTCASNRERRYREINNAVFNSAMPERKRYINGKVDIVLIYKRKGLLKTAKACCRLGIRITNVQHLNKSSK